MLVKDLSTKIHVGIDVSKLTLDAFILERKLHRKFKNNSKGFTSLFQWVKKQSRTAPDTILFCFEHTGLYSLQLALFLEEERPVLFHDPAIGNQELVRPDQRQERHGRLHAHCGFLTPL